MSTTTKIVTWTDPWDGKQKVMERRQPPARADLLPPGITVGADGKWTYVPLVKLDPKRIEKLAAGLAAQVSDDMAHQLAELQNKARAELKEPKVGQLVRILGPGPWKGVIATIEELGENGYACMIPQSFGEAKGWSEREIHIYTGKRSTFGFLADEWELL